MSSFAVVTKGQYIATLEDLKLLSDAIALLDCAKPFIPIEDDDGELAEHAVVLVERSHSTLIRILGEDVGQVYTAENVEQPA